MIERINDSATGETLGFVFRMDGRWHGETKDAENSPPFGSKDEARAWVVEQARAVAAPLFAAVETA